MPKRKNSLKLVLQKIDEKRMRELEAEEAAKEGREVVEVPPTPAPIPAAGLKRSPRKTKTPGHLMQFEVGKKSEGTKPVSEEQGRPSTSSGLTNDGKGMHPANSQEMDSVWSLGEATKTLPGPVSPISDEAPLVRTGHSAPKAETMTAGPPELVNPLRHIRRVRNKAGSEEAKGTPPKEMGPAPADVGPAPRNSLGALESLVNRLPEPRPLDLSARREMISQRQPNNDVMMLPPPYNNAMMAPPPRHAPPQKDARPVASGANIEGPQRIGPPVQLKVGVHQERAIIPANAEQGGVVTVRLGEIPAGRPQEVYLNDLPQLGTRGTQDSRYRNLLVSSEDVRRNARQLYAERVLYLNQLRYMRVLADRQLQMLTREHRGFLAAGATLSYTQRLNHASVERGIGIWSLHRDELASRMELYEARHRLETLHDGPFLEMPGISALANGSRQV